MVKLPGSSARSADRECRMAIMIAVSMRAERECAQAFDLMDGSIFDQLRESAIDLQRRAHPVFPKMSEQLIGSHRPLRLLQRIEQELTIPPMSAIRCAGGHCDSSAHCDMV